MNKSKCLCRLSVVLLCAANILYFLTFPIHAADTVPEPDNLYSGACVLMDGNTGRILFEKDGSTKMPMASTTKIMTLIVALENCNPEDTVTISSYAAGQPKVHLGVRSGQQFKLEDLYYSLMLESHNDSAVAIAEHIGSKKLSLPETKERTREQSKQAVAAFIEMMNEKARDIGCFDTYFITPNGLDATALLDNKEQRKHSTTAQDLASILMYCIRISSERETFLSITRTESHTFTDIDGKGSYHCTNHNAFLNMMDGALTGKTGFTNEAGYCYVGALNRDNKLLIVALLACGWPNNRNYKWTDTKKLMEYGLQTYEYRQIYRSDLTANPIPVKNAKATLGENAVVIPDFPDEKLEILLKEDENPQITCEISKSLDAPVSQGDIIGHVRYTLNDKTLAVYPVYAGNSVEKKTYLWCLKEVFSIFLEKK